MDSEHLLDAKGRLVPIRLVKDIDLARHQLVTEMAERAKAMSTTLAAFKRQMLSDVAAFIELSAERFGVTPGGLKGNVTLTSYDGRYKVIRQVQDRLAFDERLIVAKQLVDECVREWSRGSSDELRVLVEHAFQVDRQGKISTERVLSLRKLEITSEPWTRAMAAIGESITVTSTSTYVRIYERIGDEGEHYRPINLEFSSL